MERMSLPQAAEWSRNHLNAAGSAADECEGNMDDIVGEYENGSDFLAPCHEKYVSKGGDYRIMWNSNIPTTVITSIDWG